jgi:acetyl-CoA/propionyl-CoA carboxylase, biotin carboxylase, biotin carboxyl carrier protein
VRVDGGTEADTDLRPEYDPLLAKLMVHAADRPAAVQRLRRALDETVIGGLQTDAGFLRWLVDEPAFATGDYDTSLIPERWGGGPGLTDEEAQLAARAALDARLSEPLRRLVSLRTDSESGWGRQARREALRR